METDLHSWKEIAAYLGRGVRTVQRWERDVGLPVRRSGNKGVAAYAHTREIDCWLHNISQKDTFRMSPTASSSISDLSENRERIRKRSHEVAERSSQLLQAAKDMAALVERICERRMKRRAPG
jgi:phage terminase Nu1 subunit (DNA packaging protein)